MDYAHWEYTAELYTCPRSTHKAKVHNRVLIFMSRPVRVCTPVRIRACARRVLISYFWVGLFMNLTPHSAWIEMRLPPKKPEPKSQSPKCPDEIASIVGCPKEREIKMRNKAFREAFFLSSPLPFQNFNFPPCKPGPRGLIAKARSWLILTSNQACLSGPNFARWWKLLAAWPRGIFAYFHRWDVAVTHLTHNQIWRRDSIHSFRHSMGGLHGNVMRSRTSEFLVAIFPGVK